MKIAVIHDWLLGMRGGERCLEILCRLLPRVDLYTVFYNPRNISAEINQYQPQASVLQKLPFVEKYYRYLLPAYPLAAQSIGNKIKSAQRFERYDLVISVSHCAAKNVSVPEGVPHLCYCLTPMRYIWDQFDAYFKGRALEPLAKIIANPLRAWDVNGARSVSYFVAISDFIRARIGYVYKRTADVIYPPVRTDWIIPASQGELAEGFLCVNALVPYKNVHIIVEAFNKLGEPLTIVGRGPEEARLRKIAKDNIRFVGFVSDAELARLYRNSRAMVFAAEEDFGMTPVEMQAAGRPVIAYARGGALETVNIKEDFKTGVLFSELSAKGVEDGVKTFMEREASFSVDNCLRQVENFSAEKFSLRFMNYFSSIGFSFENNNLLTAELNSSRHA